jgi:hypothetical protein
MVFDSIQHQHPLDGLQKDPVSGHYRVLPGYGHQANRYRMNESWLDEDDNLWIDSEAVEREQQKVDAEELVATS